MGVCTRQSGETRGTINNITGETVAASSTFVAVPAAVVVAAVATVGTIARMSKRQRQTSHPAIINMALLGLDGVGKSALMVRFLTRRFIGEYDPKLESTHHYNIEAG